MYSFNEFWNKITISLVLLNLSAMDKIMIIDLSVPEYIPPARKKDKEPIRNKVKTVEINNHSDCFLDRNKIEYRKGRREIPGKYCLNQRQPPLELIA